MTQGVLLLSRKLAVTKCGQLLIVSIVFSRTCCPQAPLFFFRQRPFIIVAHEATASEVYKSLMDDNQVPSFSPLECWSLLVPLRFAFHAFYFPDIFAHLVPHYDNKLLLSIRFKPLLILLLRETQAPCESRPDCFLPHGGSLTSVARTRFNHCPAF